MKTPLAILAIAVFTGVVGYILTLVGVGAHHSDPFWALGTSIIFLVVLLVDVWMFFAIAGEDAYKWNV